MESLFISVLNMSLTASYVIGAVMLVRLFLKKAPKIISYALWAVAGLRLVIPFTFESIFSLIPFRSQPISQTAALGENVSFGSSAGAALEAIGDAANGGLGTITVHLGKTADGYPITTEAYHSEVWLMFGSYLWIIGIAVLLIYSVVSIILLNRRLHVATLIEDNIYEAENLKTPFVLGFFRPKIYIPSGLSEEEKSYIILHEQTHIRRFDHLVKMVAFFILCVHWFNPLVWVAFQLMGADMEMSCDERVLKEMGSKIKQAYSTSLLSLATGRRLINGSPLAFGEGNVKGRIKNILNFKKPAAWVMVVSIILVVALIIGFTSNRPSADFSSDWKVYKFPGYFYDRVTFTTEAGICPPSFEAINAVLVNQEMETGLTCGKAFTLVKQVGDDWRVIPFAEGLTFTQEAINLPVGVSETYNLTPDMISVKLGAGNYRIITDVWYTNEPEPVVRTVWADFTITAPDSTGWQDVRIGMLRDEVHKIMGEPLGMLSGLFGDIYKLDGGSNIIIYYDAESKVYRIKLTEPPVDTSSLTSGGPIDAPDAPNGDVELIANADLPKVYPENDELNKVFNNAKLLPEVYWATGNKTNLPQKGPDVSIPSGRLAFAFLPTRPHEEKSIFIDEATLKKIINEVDTAKVLSDSSQIDWAQADFQDYWLNLYVLTDGNVYNRIGLWGPIRYKKDVYVDISVMSVDGTHAFESWRIESPALGQILIDTWGPKFDLQCFHDVTRIDMRVLDFHDTTKVFNKATLEGSAAKEMAERMLETAKVVTGYGKCGYNIELIFTFSDGTTELGWLNGDSCTGIAMDNGPNIMFDKKITRELYKLLDYGEDFISD